MVYIVGNKMRKLGWLFVAVKCEQNYKFCDCTSGIQMENIALQKFHSLIAYKMDAWCQP